MNFQVIVLFLYYALQVETDELNHLKLPGCVVKEIDNKCIVYNCPNSTEPNFSFKFDQGTLVITCNREKRLKNFSGQNLNIFNEYKSIEIKKCDLSVEFWLAKFCHRVNVNSSKVEYLNLYKNELTTIPPNTFDNIKQIKLEFNNIKEIYQSSFYGFKFLETLELSNEPLEEIGPGTFKNLTSLRTIVLNKVEVHRLPENLFEYNKLLTKIKLTGLNITELPNGLFSNLDSLSEVTLMNTSLMNIPSDTFRGSTKIKLIDLSYNQLRYISNGLFDGLTKLQELYVRSNKLQVIPNWPFRDLNNLEILNLQDNQIRKISNNQFKGLKYLKKLYLNSNMIEVIESKAMEPLERFLEYANFRFNRISLSEYHLKPEKSPFRMFFRLEELHLGYNNISMMFKRGIYSSHLRILDLEHNKIDKLTGLGFQLHNLHIDLSNNNFRSIEFNTDTMSSEEWKNLKFLTINISHNPIICDCNLYNFQLYEETKRTLIPPEESVNFIKTICEGPTAMKGTKLADVESENLVCDNVNSTTKTVCPYPCSCKFSPYKNADLVDCSNRNLIEAPNQLFRSRENVSIHLNLTGNKLTKLPSKDQPNYHLVKELYASHNQIERIDETNVIDNMKVLVLDHNNLKSLTSTTMNAMKIAMGSIDRMILNYNFWPCDCESEDLFSFLKAHSHVYEHDIICFTNKKLFATMNFSDVCSNSNNIIIISAMISSIAVSSVIVTILYHKYRQEIRSWMYFHNCCLCLLPQQDFKDERPYDAFISCSQQDEHFVKTELVPKLESGPQPYKLCLQHRDWLEGDSIRSQVKKSVEKSKTTVIVLSKNYVTNVWGAMEYAASPKKALIETKSRVIVMIYGDMPIDDELDDELKSFLKLDLHTEWGNKWFWDKLRYALPYRPRIVGLQTTEQSGTTIRNSSDNTSPHIESYTVNERENGCEHISLRDMFTPPDLNSESEQLQSEIRHSNWHYNYDYDYHKRYRRLNIPAIQ